MGKESRFRLWINEMYYRYKDENELWRSPDRCKEAKQYFRENKWFLKKLYKQEGK